MASDAICLLCCNGIAMLCSIVWAASRQLSSATPGWQSVSTKSSSGVVQRADAAVTVVGDVLYAHGGYYGPTLEVRARACACVRVESLFVRVSEFRSYLVVCQSRVRVASTCCGGKRADVCFPCPGRHVESKPWECAHRSGTCVALCCRCRCATP